MLTKVKKFTEGEIIQTQYGVLNGRIDLYFYAYKIGTEIAENRRRDRNIDYGINFSKCHRLLILSKLL